MEIEVVLGEAEVEVLEVEEVAIEEAEEEDLGVEEVAIEEVLGEEEVFELFGFNFLIFIHYFN